MSLAPFELTIEPGSLDLDPTLVGWLRRQSPTLSGREAHKLIVSGKLWVEGQVWTNPTRKLKVGLKVAYRPNAPRLDRAPREEGPPLAYLDKAVVVADKPVDLLTIPLREERESLSEWVRRTLPRKEGRSGGIPPLLAVHRLDKLASGLVVFARSVVAQRGLQVQFADHSVVRRYLALVQGEARFTKRRVESVIVADRGDGLKGSTLDEDAGGKEAITHFEVVGRYKGATLLSCRLETGRTHQIRIHASEMGYPIVGDPVYIRNMAPRRPMPAPRMMLHAAELGFIHPLTGEALRFESAPPATYAAFLKTLEPLD